MPSKSPKSAGSPTSSKTATRTSTKTSTVANPKGNVTVTGGAGDGNTQVTIDKARAPKAGGGESKKGYDRSGHFPGNPGFPGTKGKKYGPDMPGGNTQSRAKRDAPNVGAGNSKDFKGTNKGYPGATHDRNAAFMNRERAPKAGGVDVPPAKGSAPKRGGGESKKGYDRSGHFQGNPGFPESKHVHNQTYSQEQHEHWGSKAEGSSMSTHKSAPANVGSESRGSSLVGETGEGHVNQGKGDGTGVKTTDHGTEGRMKLGPAHSFPTASGGHSFGHGAHVRNGALRMSGHPGAHRIGKR